MPEWFECFVACAEIAGTVAFAASGAMIAIERELDMFGVLFLGVTAAVGGGILRDLFLGVTPPSAFQDAVYVSVAAAVALAAFLFAWRYRRQYRKRQELLNRIVDLLDAVGLGFFGVVGVQTAMALGHGGNMFLCVFMGMTTGVGGGILRDIFSRAVPAVLRKRIYAVACILGCAVYYLLRRAEMAVPAAMLSGAAVTIAIRLCAARFRWNLPVAREKKQ